MKLISRLRGRCFCAFCKAERKVYVKKHIDLTNVVGAILLAMAVGQAYYGAPDPRALVIFCMTILILEVFVYMRWRASIICTLCGFDPLVYKRSPEQAAQMVRAFYKEKNDNPEFWLSRSPLVERKRKERVKERQASNHTNLVARLAAKQPKPAPALPKAAPKAASKSSSSLASPKGP